MLFIVIVILIISTFAGLLLLVDSDENNDLADSNQAESVVEISGKQIITITASGGYSPSKIEAKAGVPTTLKVKSLQAFGCESFLRIPKLNISKILPANGETEIDLGILKTGSKISGTCSMGMYYFEISFT